MRAARKARGFTQADIARLLEISRATYAKYETGALLPHHLIGEFAEITGVTITELYRGLRYEHCRPAPELTRPATVE